MKITQPGIYRGIDTADYFADPCPQPSLSQSLCKILLERSMGKVKESHPRLAAPVDEDDEAEKYVKAQAIGNAAHKLMIGRGKEIEIIQFGDFRKNDAKDLRDAAIADGRVPILEKHFGAAERMVAAARDQLSRHKDRDAFTAGAGEVALIWQDGDIWCRALVDWLHDDLRTVDDYKTSGMSMAPHVIGLRAQAAGWEIQAAFIERGLDALDPDGRGRRLFRFIGQEQDGLPHALTSMHMDEHWMTMGRKKVAAAMAKWRVSLRLDRWPLYGNQPVVPEYPGFKESQWLDREMSGEFEPDPKLVMAG